MSGGSLKLAASTWPARLGGANDLDPRNHLLVPILRIISIAGRFAVTPALYAAGAALLIAALAGRQISAIALLGVASTALAMYLVDRIQPEWWRGRRAVSTHPEREQTLRRWLLAALTLLTGSFLVAVWALSRIHSWLTILPALGAATTLLYARGGSSGHRVKDVLIVKNVVVAVGIAGFAAAVIATIVLVGGGFASPEDVSALIAAALVMAGFISVDALLCDIPDRGADRVRDTHTIPVVFGTRAAWRIAQSATVILALITAGLGALGALDLAAGLIAAVSLVATVFAAPGIPTSLLRDAIDLRLAIVALLVHLFA